MIDDHELRARAAALGVTEDQIRRDHLLSHLISALENLPAVAFIGGTALNRTHLVGRRLSEDLDLYLTDDQLAVETVLQHLVTATRREFPDLRAIDRNRREDVTTVWLRDSGPAVKTQLIARRHEWSLLQYEPTPVRLFYSDLPETVTLLVPTRAAFTSMKLTAYTERRSPRDLYDLSGLLVRGRLPSGTIRHVRHLLGRDLTLQEFPGPPGPDEWEAELRHQVRDLDPVEEAHRRVIAAISAVFRG